MLGGLYSLAVGLHATLVGRMHLHATALSCSAQQLQSGHLHTAGVLDMHTAMRRKPNHMHALSIRAATSRLQYPG